MIKRLIFLLLVSCFLIPVSHAAIPHLLSFQGILKNSADSYLNGNYSLTFRIYSASSGGTAIWSETQSSVSVTSGRFNTQLGSVTALNLDFSQDYWLSVQVASDAEMTPRGVRDSMSILQRQILN